MFRSVLDMLWSMTLLTLARCTQHWKPAMSEGCSLQAKSMARRGKGRKSVGPLSVRSIWVQSALLGMRRLEPRASLLEQMPGSLLSAGIRWYLNALIPSLVSAACGAVQEAAEGLTVVFPFQAC